MKPRISGVILRVAGWIMTPNNTPNYTQFVDTQNHAHLHPLSKSFSHSLAGALKLKASICRSSTPPGILTTRSEIHRATLSKRRCGQVKKLMPAFRKASNVD
jgi:hypothetical protein